MGSLLFCSWMVISGTAAARIRTGCEFADHFFEIALCCRESARSSPAAVTGLCAHFAAGPFCIGIIYKTGAEPDMHVS